jgi:hypothetical protein
MNKPNWKEAPTNAIGAFVPTNRSHDTRQPFFVKTKQESDFMDEDGFEGVKCSGEDYHVFSECWEWVPRAEPTAKPDYTNLLHLTEKATQGEWWIDSHGHRVVSLDSLDTVFVADDRMGPATRHPETGNLSHWPNDWDASYIVAAQPSVVKGLIEEVLELRAFVEPVAPRHQGPPREVARDPSGVEGYRSAEVAPTPRRADGEGGRESHPIRRYAAAS